MIVRLDSTEDLDPQRVSKRGKYEIWRGFGSDGYLYDFVDRNREGRGYRSSKPKYGLQRLPLMFFKSPALPALQSLRGHKYDIWPGFGSDGYLYDFVK